MYSISDKFKESVYAPVRTTKARVTFDISDTTIANDTITTAVTSEFAVSAKAQLTDKKREQNYNIATCELDRFKLDGSFTFADDTLSNNGQVGWCSNPLCDSSGLFTPNQVLTFTFGSTHSSMGITVTFDVLNNEYATDYTIKAYDASNAIITTVDYIGNDKVQVASLGQFYLYKKIEIIIKKWSKPYRRARVCEVDFGVVRVYQDDNLIRCSLIEDMDITTGQLPSPEFKFTVDNASREFNILNPSGFYKFLQQRQQVLAELGVVTGSNCEYVPLGNYLLWDWTSDEGSITASFTARTNLDIMSGYSYENLVAKSSYSLYQMAVDIFTECGITNYQIDTALQSILTNGLIKKIDCRSAIQMIAIAGCANIFVTRDNKITLKLNSTR